MAKRKQMLLFRHAYLNILYIIMYFSVIHYKAKSYHISTHLCCSALPLLILKNHSAVKLGPSIVRARLKVMYVNPQLNSLGPMSTTAQTRIIPCDLGTLIA